MPDARRVVVSESRFNALVGDLGEWRAAFVDSHGSDGLRTERARRSLNGNWVVRREMQAASVGNGC